MRRARTILGSMQPGTFPLRRDLNVPIALVRSSRLPDEGMGFTQELRAYFKGMAKHRQSPRKPMEGNENADPVITHVFTFDYTNASVEVRDFVVRGSTLYRITSTRLVEKGSVPYFVVVETTEMNRIGGATGDAINVILDETPDTSMPNSNQNPFWTDTP